tara:strand:+ start:61 stop:288 length:228 start_codon:yes stop_codon:yes gene_type:complete
MDRESFNEIIDYFVVGALQRVINLINARIIMHEREGRSMSSQYTQPELDIMEYEAKEIIKEIRNLKEMEVNNKNG